MKISCDISILARRRYKGNPRHCPIMAESGSLGLKNLEVNISMLRQVKNSIGRKKTKRNSKMIERACHRSFLRLEKKRSAPLCSDADRSVISGLGGNRTRVQKPIQCTSTIISCSCGIRLAGIPFPASGEGTVNLAGLVASSYAHDRKA